MTGKVGRLVSLDGAHVLKVEYSLIRPLEQGSGLVAGSFQSFDGSPFPAWVLEDDCHAFLHLDSGAGVHVVLARTRPQPNRASAVLQRMTFVRAPQD